MKTIRKIEKSSAHCFARLRVAAYCRVSTDQYEQLEEKFIRGKYGLGVGKRLLR